MKITNFKYEKVGNIIMIDEVDWWKIVKYLTQHGILVTEKTPNTACTRRGGTVAKKDKVAKPPRG